MNNIKVFLTVEVEKDDSSELISDVFNLSMTYSKKLREKYDVPSQVKFTDLPRKFTQPHFKPASELDDLEQ